MVLKRDRSIGFNEDALSGALLASLGHCVLVLRGDGSHLGGTPRIVADGSLILNVGQAVVEQGEYRRAYLFAKPIASTKILVNPDLHSYPFVRYRVAFQLIRLAVAGLSPRTPDSGAKVGSSLFGKR